MPYLRVDSGIKVEQGLAVWEAIANGATYRQAAAAAGMSTTTAWRRCWFVRDWTLPAVYGRPPGPIPPQRGTAACPRGRPYLPTLDTDRSPHLSPAAPSGRSTKDVAS